MKNKLNQLKKQLQYENELFKELFHVIKKIAISLVDLIFCIKTFFEIINDRRIMNGKKFVKIISIAIL